MAGGAKVRCYEINCFQNSCGMYCRLLEKPITGHDCPFFKTHEEADYGRRETIRRLTEIGRPDLISIYVMNPEKNW